MLSFSEWYKQKRLYDLKLEILAKNPTGLMMGVPVYIPAETPNERQPIPKSVRTIDDEWLDSHDPDSAAHETM